MRPVQAALLVLACCGGDAQAEVQFLCPAQLVALQQEVPVYLRSLEIPIEQVVQSVDVAAGTLTLALSTAAEDTRTLDFSTRPGFSLKTERVRLPAAGGKSQVITTVSRKEIVLALLQHGRRKAAR